MAVYKKLLQSYPDHARAVTRIAGDVQHFFAAKQPFRINHGSTNSTRQRRLQQDKQEKVNLVDISELSRVLRVDTATRTALVEPNVPMDRLVEATLPHGLIPPVVMEFPGITAGGGFAGTGGESSSFKFGYFNETVNWIEIVLGNGEVVLASREENADLFHGASGSVGSLGITTALELKLIPAKKYVKTTYTRVESVKQAVELLQTLTLARQNHEIDYLDGILYSPNLGAVVTGVLSDDADNGRGHVQRFSGARDPWFYLHVRDRISDKAAAAVSTSSSSSADKTTETRSTPYTVTEYIPLAEYLFRYDRGGFWVGESAFKYFKNIIPFTSGTRWFLDDFMHTRMLYKALHAAGQPPSYIVQDLGIPFDTVERFIDYTTTEWGVWPLWLCPLRQPSHLPSFHPHSLPRSAAASSSKNTTTTTASTTGPTDSPSLPDATPGAASEYLLNVGLWGYSARPLTSASAFLQANKALEAKVHELGGMKWLYAHTFYTESEFWATYGPRAWYDALRAKWHADSLPSTWQKVVVRKTGLEKQGRSLRSRLLRDVWPFQGLYGVWKAMWSSEWRIARRSTWKNL